MRRRRTDSCSDRRRVANRVANIDRRGVAAVEFAVIGAIILTLLLAVFDFGFWIWTQMSFQSALAAGAAYAQVFPTEQTGIVTTITGALPPGLADGATVTPPVPACDCGAGGGTPSAAQCSTSCGAGSQKRVYVTLSVSRPFSPLYFTSFSTNAARFVVRVQ